MRAGLLRDLIAGAGLSVTLLAAGLGLTGNTARALSFADGRGPSALQALPGSESRAGELVIAGVPTRVRKCRTSDLPASVFARYRQQASAESGELPWLESDDEDGGGIIAWVTVDPVLKRAKLKKSVRVVRDPSGHGCMYELLESDLEAPGPRALPADLPLPAGCSTAFSVLGPDGTGTALINAPGSPSAAAERLLDALRSRGFEVDRQGAATFEGPPGTPITVPFAAPGRRGVLQVVPAEGGARISLSIAAG